MDINSILHSHEHSTLECKHAEGSVPKSMLDYDDAVNHKIHSDTDNNPAANDTVKCQAIINVLRIRPNASYDSISQSINVSRSTVARSIKAMDEQGIIRRVGPDKGGHWEIIK